jgi:DNA-binding LytR/AlgR family response regulator
MEKEFKVLIVEDDMIIAADISMQLAKMGYRVVGMCTRAEDAIGMIKSNEPDIVLMDVILSGKMNGIEAAEIILNEAPTPLIFLTSNYDDATFQKALKTKPYAFIAKPFQKSELERALKITANRLTVEKQESQLMVDENEDDHVSTMKDRIFLRHKGEMVKVLLSDILYVEADRNYCIVKTAEKEILLSIPLSRFEINLPENRFLRTHRSFLVNIFKIDAVSEHSEYINIDKFQVPISRRQKDEVIKRLNVI